MVSRKFGEGDWHEAEEMRGYSSVRAEVVLIIISKHKWSLGKVGALLENCHGWC
jgi:hypothetical protein